MSAVQSKKLLLALLYFGLTVAYAFYQDWQARDLVWSMWLGSLVGGYAFIVLGIARAVFSSSAQMPLARGVFLLAFFTVHFGGFHFGHAQFTQDFFPLALSDSASFPELLRSVFDEYWPFALVALLHLGPALATAGESSNSEQPDFITPYKAVIKNHLMIFVVGFASAAGAQSALLYLLLVLYFFPFELLRRTAPAKP